jgi:hypothetical protein
MHSLKHAFTYVIILLVFAYQADLVCSSGIPLQAEGTVLDSAQQKKVFRALVTNPASLLSSIDFIQEAHLKEKKRELKERLFEKIGISDRQKLLKIRRMFAQDVGFVHEDFINADITYQILKKNPFIIRQLFPGSRSLEEGTVHSRRELREAFDALASSANFNISLDQYFLLKEQYQDVPFFTLFHHIRECLGCGASRLKYPFIRQYFENQVVEYVQRNYPNKDQELIITDFASGNVFQIFVTLNKLVAAGYKKIRLNLIDIEYAGILGRLQQEVFGASGAVIQPGALKINANDMNLFVNMFRGPTGVSMGTRDEVLAVSAFADLVNDSRYNNMFAYFIQWFNGTPLDLTLTVYGDARDYLADCDSNPALKSDLLLAVDYYTELNPILENLRKNGLKDSGRAFSMGHSDVGEHPESAEFYYSTGSQNQGSMKHFEWDLKEQKLKSVPFIPDTLDFYISQARLFDLFAIKG